MERKTNADLLVCLFVARVSKLCHCALLKNLGLASNLHPFLPPTMLCLTSD